MGESTPPAAVFLVIDCSGSMAGKNLERARQGSVDFAERALAGGYAVGLIQFASTATLVCEPQRDLSALRGYAEKLEAGGMTEMGRGIAMADANLGGQGGPRAIVVVTDGLPTKRREGLAAAERAKRRGIQIIAIGTGDADEGFLKQISSGDERAVMVPLVDLASGIRSSARMLAGGHADSLSFDG